MARKKTAFDSRPTAQQLLGAVVKAMRLRPELEKALGSSTRKTLEQGQRVKPATRTEYVLALASALVDLGYPRPLEDGDPVGRQGLIDGVAPGIGEYCIAWDHCQNYFESYGRRSLEADPLLILLPMLRLALQDLGVRVALYYLPWHRELPPTLPSEGPGALVDGSAFIRYLRHQLGLRGIRRSDLHTEVFGASSYEAWEAGGLPQSDSLKALGEALGQDQSDRMRLELELRVVVALVELWKWLAEIGLPQSHRLELAQSFLDWTMKFADGFATGQDGTAQEIEELRLWGIVVGARQPAIGDGVRGMARLVTDGAFEQDLCSLPGDWSQAIKRWHAYLNEETGPQDARLTVGADLPASWSDRDVVAWAMVHFRLLDDPTIDDVLDLTRDPRLAVPDPDAPPKELPSLRDREAHATNALEAGAFKDAERILRAAIDAMPTEPWLHIKLAQALEGQRRYPEAEMEVLVAIGLDRSITDAHMLRGRILLFGGKPEGALEALEDARHLAPENAVIPEFEGYSLLALGRTEDALQAFVKSRELNPRHCPGWTREAMTLVQLGRLREAEKAAKQAAHLGDHWVLGLVRQAKAQAQGARD